MGKQYCRRDILSPFNSSLPRDQEQESNNNIINCERNICWKKGVTRECEGTTNKTDVWKKRGEKHTETKTVIEKKEISGSEFP